MTRLYPIDPWQGEPLPDAYDLLIYAKNGYLGEPSRISQFGFSAHKVIVDFGHLLSAQVEKHELAPYSLRKVGPGSIRDSAGPISGAKPVRTSTSSGALEELERQQKR